MVGISEFLEARIEVTIRGRRLPNLKALCAFEAAARHLSFSTAAEELSVTQSAISRQIKSLETYFGMPLFKRLTRAVELTEPGARYASEVQNLFDRLEQATQLLQFSEKRRTLTINTFPTLAMQFLVPRLSKFNIAHPEIEVRLVTSMEPVDFSDNHPDIAIRFQPPVRTRPIVRNSNLQISEETHLEMVTAWAGVRSDLLLTGKVTPVCSREFLSKYGPFEKAADFCDVPLLHNIAGGRAWGDWFRSFNLPYNPANIVASFSHYFMALQAAQEGLGVALVPGFESLGTGLIQLTDFTFESGGGYYLLSLDKEWDSEPIRLFREWIMQEINTERC